MGRGDADDGEEFHVEARNDAAVVLQGREFGGHFQRLGAMRGPLRMAVNLHRSKTTTIKPQPAKIYK